MLTTPQLYQRLFVDNKKHLIKHSDLVENNILPEIGSVITDFLAGPCVEKNNRTDETPPRAHLAFSWSWHTELGVVTNFSARNIAHALITGEIDRAITWIIEAIKAFPDLMHTTFRIRDHAGRRLQGTLLQLAAMNFDVNPCASNQAAIGAVERIITLGFLSNQQVQSQLDAVLPNDHWHTLTAPRMQRYKDAMIHFANTLAEIPIHDASWDQMLSLSQEARHTFNKALFNHSDDEVITQGLVFDPSLFSWFCEQYWRANDNPLWATRLGGAQSIKSRLLFVIGFSGFQAIDTASGLQVHQTGIYNVVKKNIAPRRDATFLSGHCSEYATLGHSHFLDLKGRQVNNAPRNLAGFFDQLTAQKRLNYLNALPPNPAATALNMFACGIW